jgi:hypothetical protein
MLARLKHVAKVTTCVCSLWPKVFVVFAIVACVSVCLSTVLQ